jgi:two-component system cell cycle response regulator DivK
MQNSPVCSFFNPKSKIENPKLKRGGLMAQKKILVVDDTEWNRDLIVQLLEDEYTVLEALDGEEAVRKTEADKPDLILMDLGMPVMDGWEATRKIKANDALKHIPIIAVTSHAMVGDEIDARKAGCDDYLPKPIDETELLRKIKSFIG